MYKTSIYLTIVILLLLLSCKQGKSRQEQVPTNTNEEESLLQAVDPLDDLIDADKVTDLIARVEAENLDDDTKASLVAKLTNATNDSNTLRERLESDPEYCNSRRTRIICADLGSGINGGLEGFIDQVESLSQTTTTRRGTVIPAVMTEETAAVLIAIARACIDGNSVADLAISKTESIDPVSAGSDPSNLTYIVTIINNGSFDATGVEVTETLALPANVTTESITPSKGSFADPIWTVGDLTNGESATLEIVLTVALTAAIGTDVISDTAEITAANEIDPDPANNSVTESTSIIESEAPIITSSDTVSMAAENQTDVIDIESVDNNDSEGAGLTYSFTTDSGGGIDNALFNIDVFKTVHFFELGKD